jgi:hypothetical protein
VVAGLLVAGGWEVALGQSLGEVAEKEKARRSGKAARYSDDDLKARADPRASPEASPAPVPSGKPAKPTPGVAPTPRAPTTEERRQAVQGERQVLEEQVAAAAKAVAEAESRVAGSNLDQGTEDVGDPFREQNRRARTGDAVAQLEAAKLQLAGAQKALADWQERMRREGVPGGWY